MGYRKKIEIVADILVIARKGAKKTHIMYRGNLSFKLLNVYLETVLRAGLLMVDRENGHYLLTEKGKSFLARFSVHNRRVKNLEKQSERVKGESTLLEQMCFAMDLPNSDGLANSEGVSRNSSVKRFEDSDSSVE